MFDHLMFYHIAMFDHLTKYDHLMVCDHKMMFDHFPATPPSQRVQFLLGREELEEDEDRQAHDMFCEMEELRAIGDEGEKEWKETARCVNIYTSTSYFNCAG